MKIPSGLRFKQHLHGHGDGMYLYEWLDVTGLGVMMRARGENGVETRTWYLKSLPGMEFGSLPDLQKSAALLTPEDIAAEASMYPYIRTRKPDLCGNACRLCPRQPLTPGHRVIHDTVRYAVATCWRDVYDASVSLCKAHDAQYQNDPVGLLAAMHDRVKQATGLWGLGS